MRLIDGDALMEEVMDRHCNDCEHRKGVKNGKWKIVYSIGDAPCRACGIGDMIDYLEDAPTIEERKKGKWYAIGNSCLASCECGFFTDKYSAYRFCPNCGADNREEKT